MNKDTVMTIICAVCVGVTGLAFGFDYAGAMLVGIGIYKVAEGIVK